jgi:hypothetical protein
MSNTKSRAFRTLASLTIVGLGACSTAGDSASRIAAPSGPSAHLGEVVVAPQTATVCKSGPLGSYSFTVANSGATNEADVLSASPVTLTVTDAGVPACAVIFTRTTFAGGTFDLPAVITVTENASPLTTLSSITVASAPRDGARPAVVNLAGRSAEVAVNAFHSVKVTFVNEAIHVAGCTYTQGWYKNPKHMWPAGFSRTAKFDGGMSWIDLYNTPPRGSQYIILAHQYMTTTMNIASGASVPAYVQTAYDKATAYFLAGGNGTGAGDIAGVAAILDEYNNGLASGGPAHCG